MIHEVDSALRTLIARDAPGTRDVEVVFDAPTREWAGRRNSPTIDIYLYDIREDLRRRERGMHNVYDESNTIVSRHLPPRHFKLSYLVTAWTQRPEDEHRLLSSLLTCFLRYEALPADVLTGPLTDLGLPIPITIALPPPEDRAFADVWSALGGELKPSIDLVVITPLDTGQQFHTGPPVEVPPHVSLGGSLGWPTRETKSRNGVVAWPEGGAHGPGVAEAPLVDSSAGSQASDEKRASAASGSRGESRTAKGGSASEAGGPGSRAAPSEAGAAVPDDWEIATGWAAGMAPLGSPGSSEPLPERAAGRRQAGAGASAGSLAAAADQSGTGEEPDPASGSRASGGRSSGAARKATTGSAKTGGRPGPRVAITRKRQTKKDS